MSKNWARLGRGYSGFKQCCRSGAFWPDPDSTILPNIKTKKMFAENFARLTFMGMENKRA